MQPQLTEIWFGFMEFRDHVIYLLLHLVGRTAKGTSTLEKATMMFAAAALKQHQHLSRLMAVSHRPGS